VQSEIDARPTTLGVLKSVRHLFADGERTLRAQGRFFEKNLGHVTLDPAVRFLDADFGTLASERRRIPRVRDALQLVFDEVRGKLGQPRSPEPIPFSTFALGRPIA
jgi:hypothetical protein